MFGFVGFIHWQF